MRRRPIALATALALAVSLVATTAMADNPIVTDIYTADPSALVHDGRMYVYTGRDEAEPGQNQFVMREWHAFSSHAPATEPEAWTHHGALLSLDDFTWAQANAWASEVEIGADGRFYWFASVDGATDPGWMNIGVAVGDSPIGPFTDAIGGPLIRDDMPNSSALNIDPTVLVDGDGSVYMWWGSFWEPRMVRLGADMTTLASEIIEPVGLAGFWEAPWIFKRDGTYYMAYASNENIGGDGCVTSSSFACVRYATAESPLGPWTHRGIVLDEVSSTTNHPAIAEFEGEWWMVYHTADAPGGGNFRRALAIDRLFFNDDGTMQKVVQTPIPVEPDPEPSDNVALAAEPSASYTSPWETVTAINDGVEPAHSNDATSPQWGTWPNSGTQWVQLDWERPVKVSASEMYFFQDVPDEFDGGVKRPESWSISYWDGEAHVEVPNATGYPTDLDTYNHTSFDPVVTTSLRATLQSQAFSGAGGVGVLEWKVNAVQPAKVRAVHVPTSVGEEPNLPQTAILTYDDGSSLEAGLRWKRFDPALLDAPDTSFAVEGVADGSLLTVPGTVYVRGDPDPALRWLEDEELLIGEGVTPTLPATVLARYVDGSADNVTTAVTWDETQPEDFAALGTVTVLGMTAITDAAARANVTTCSEILRGSHAGSLSVTSGVVCLDGATIEGDVAVEPGAGLVAVDSTVAGSVTANKAWLLRLVRTEVGDSVTVTNGSGRVDVAGASLGAGLNLIRNQTQAATLVSDSDIDGVLNCQGNQPAPVDEDRPNRVGGRVLGQCTGLVES